jgi:Ser/Thr protein kinase RdoA (MazF antagonist)
VKDFSELTLRGRARRLRRIASAALEHYSLDVIRVRLITNSFNCIFRVDTSDREKYVLRVNLPHQRTLQEIRSEMTWLAALRRDTDLGVPEPLPTHDGALVTTVKAEGVPEPRHCVIFSWMPGLNLSERLSEENIRKLGELTAQLHNHADLFVLPKDCWCRTYDRVFPFEDTVLFDETYAGLFYPERRAIYERAMERVQEALDRLNADRRQLRVLHADLHQWNVKVYRGRLYALDFDDCMWGYPVQDIAITWFYLQDHEQYAAFRVAYKRGYTQHRGWPKQYPGEIDTFVAGRALVLVNFLVQDDAPEYQAMIPDYVERTEDRLRVFLQK